MAKVKFTEEELNLLKSTVDIYNKSKTTVLDEFNKTYPWNFECKAKWFDNKEAYYDALNTLTDELFVAKKVVSKLNCISDREWGRVV